jgi:hypothetical protein
MTWIRTIPAEESTGERVSLQDVLLGVTFLLALGAFIQSPRNARRSRGPARVAGP